MKKLLLILLIIGAVAVGTLIYGASKPSKQSFSSQNNTKQQKPPPPTQNTINPQAKSENTVAVIKSEKDSTGIAYSTYQGPTPDVSETLNLGNGNVDVRLVEAKTGQYIKLTFTANIRDELRIEGYNATTNVEPGRESGIALTVNKVGQFPIKLVKTNKIVGTLIIKE